MCEGDGGTVRAVEEMFFVCQACKESALRDWAEFHANSSGAGIDFGRAYLGNYDSFLPTDV